MKNLQYKKVTTTTLKVGGILDADRMVIDVDGVEKDIKTLLSDFDGDCIELNIERKCSILRRFLMQTCQNSQTVQRN